jgi:hypothetical protein
MGGAVGEYCWGASSMWEEALRGVSRVVRSFVDLGGGWGCVDVPVLADVGDARALVSGLFSSIDEAFARVASFCRQRRKITSPMMVRKPSVPPTAPPMTALRLELPPPELGEGDADDVDRGAVEESRMLRSLKYSY